MCSVVWSGKVVVVVVSVGHGVLLALPPLVPRVVVEARVAAVFVQGDALPT